MSTFTIEVLSPDKRYSIKATGAKGEIKTVDKSAKAVKFLLPTATNVRNKIVFSPNSAFAVVGERGKFQRISLNSEASLIGTVNAPISGVLLKLGLSPDGKILAVETNMSRLEVLDLTTGRAFLSKEINDRVKGYSFEEDKLVVSFESDRSREFDLSLYPTS